MTAGAGILHEEFHSAAFARVGGMMQMIQLWVNLPAKDKMTSPGYQPILRQQIPELALANGSGTARVIAGSFGGETGPARTFTPMQVVDLKLKKARRLRSRCQRAGALDWLCCMVQFKRKTVLSRRMHRC